MVGHRDRKRVRLRRWGVTAVVVGVVGIVGALVLAPASMAADGRGATATLTELTVTDVAALGVAGFSGEYGTAVTPDLSAASDVDNGDLSDPDRVLDHVTVNGTQLVETSWDAGSTQLTARANATGFELGYNGVDDFLTSGSVDSYARCLDRGGALAYARGDGSSTYVLGQRVPEGVPTTINVTGAQLNMPDVASGTLTVTVTRVETTVETPTEVSAEAYLAVTIDGDLKDAAGTSLYRGVLVNMKVGHVRVSCKPAIAPSRSSASRASGGESPSDESPSTDSSSDETPSQSPSSVDPRTVTPSPTAPTSDLTDPTSDVASSGSHATGPDTSPSDSDDASGLGPFLPITGGSTILTGLVVGLSLALLGVVLLNVAARRSRA